MLVRFRKFLQLPGLENLEMSLQAQNLNSILLFMLALTVLYLLYTIFFPPSGQVLVAILALTIEIGLLLLVRFGKLRLASILLASLLWIAILFEEISYGGVRDSGFASFAAVIVVTELILGIRAGIVITLLTILSGTGLIYAETMGLLPAYPSVSNSSILISHSITFIAVLLLVNLAVRSITQASRKIIEESQVTRETSKRLELNQAELNTRSELLTQRNLVIKLLTEISALLIQIRNENELLDKVAHLLGERLGYENIDIYLMDHVGEYAVLRASNHEIRKEQKIEISRGDTTYTAAGDNAINYQTGEGNIHLSHPIAKEGMLTNIILPLMTHDWIIGFLNVQSLTAKANEDETTILQTISNQIAVTLENLRLSSQLQSQEHEIEKLAGKTTQDAWKNIGAGKSIGYQYDRIQVLPGIDQYPEDITMQLRKAKSVTYVTTGEKQSARLISPIILRGQVIGVIGYEEEDPRHVWENDRIIVLETIASQVGMALENTRLISEAQQRAQQEKTISEVTSSIRETLDMETILQTALREMRRSFNLMEAEIRLPGNQEEPKTVNE